MVFPSLESIEQRWSLPKVNFFVYEYFYKAVIQDSVWNDRVNAPSTGTDASRLGPVISEAYAHAALRNHYFAWMYQYKIDHPNNTLVTECDQRDEGQGGNDDDEEQQETEIDLFCGSLVLTDCEISVPETTAGDFKILLSSTADPAAHKAAKDHDQEIIKGIKANIDHDRQGNGDDGNCTRHESYKKMSETVNHDAAMINQENVANTKKRKRKSKSGMTVYTSSTRKSKKGSTENVGWSAEGKKLVCQLFQEIKQDETSGIRKKWEIAYKRMSKAINEDQAKAVDNDDEIEAPFDMDANMLYMEV